VIRLYKTQTVKTAIILKPYESISLRESYSFLWNDREPCAMKEFKNQWQIAKNLIGMKKFCTGSIDEYRNCHPEI